jgi:cytidine deaminase
VTAVLDTEALVRSAREVRERAYAPYSGFLVGASVSADGQTFAAPNLEVASYPLSVCAERNATAMAVAAGHRRIEAVAVVGTGDEPTPPCGGCRQVLHEFGGAELIVVAESASGRRVTWKLGELLPHPFGPENLGRDLG